MEQDREVDSVMMNIKNSSGAIMSATLFSARTTFKLITFLYRLVKKGMVSLGTADKFKNFSNTTGGKYTAYNIPLDAKKAQTMRELNKLEIQLEQVKNPLEKASLRRQIENLQHSIPELGQLNKLGISYCVLPKLNGSDQTMQIVVSNEDDQLFKNWFGNHLTAAMSTGGEKNLESIKVFTEGNYTILNMPFEEMDELGEMMSDFNTMKINYAILPDLNVGDGFTQVAIPNVNRNQVEQWFNMWKERAIKNGQTPSNMFSMDENSYLNTAEVTADDYIGKSDAQYQDVQKSFEQESKAVPFSAGPGKENSEEFIRFMQDDKYEKITINRETLVEFENNNYEAYKKQGIFASRIPGTYGQNEQTLLIPMEQVFETDNGKTYVAFLDKTANSMVCDKQGATQAVNTEELKKTYDKVDRGFDKVKSMQGSVKKVAEKTPNISAPKIDFKI